MIKKQNLKKQAIGIKKERIILWAVILILILLQAISAWYLVQLRNYNSLSSKESLYSFIAKVEERRYKYPVIDIANSRVYIPEARVYVPLNDSTRDLRYEFVNIQDNKSLHLSMSSTVGVQNETDDSTCDQVVVLSTSKERTEPTYSNAGEIQPTMNGLRYISVHNKATCSVYNDSVQNDLVKVAKSITQY